MTTKQAGFAAARLKRLHDRHRQLSRHYELIANWRMYRKGFLPLPILPRLRLHWQAQFERHFLPHYFSYVPNWRILLRRLTGPRTLPDFCVIGVPKGASSDLGVKLLLHPNVMTPLVKEFWTPDPDSWRVFYPTEREKRRHVRRYGLALSPLYMPILHHMEFAHLLSTLQPRPKIVITLREPADRVFSQWKWEILFAGKRRAARLPFLATFPQYVDRLLSSYPETPMFTACGYCAVQASIYWKAVETWRESFGCNNVLMLSVEDYFNDPGHTLRRIQEFVGLPHVPLPPTQRKVNENPLQLPPPDEASMTRLREFFRPHNEKLWALIGERWNWH